MEDLRRYLSDESWLIHEKGWDSSKQSAYESLFTLGNGYLGSRGVLEEIPYDASVGTYIAGVFDKSVAQLPELVNAPNPIDFRIVVQGEKLDIKGMKVLDHQRALDLQKGILVRRTLFSDRHNRKFHYQSIRFFSMADEHLGAMQVLLRPLDSRVTVTIQDAVDTSVTNKGVFTEGRKTHFQLIEVSSSHSINYLCVETFDYQILLAYATHLTVKEGRREFSPSDSTFDLTIRKNEIASFTKIFSVYTSREVNKKRIKNVVITSLKKNLGLGFERLLQDHRECWRERWEGADVEIDGDSEAERLLRFNIYHMLICGNRKDSRVGIGARTLSGEGYRGHIFWDTEIFLLPFFIYTDPRVAQNLLLYRYHRLEAARKNAKEKGYHGTLFPWESADTGEEVAPSWYKDLDGSIMKIRTMELEHHIVSDIAYGVLHYYRATNDWGFMLRYGAEIVFETARFWASRVHFNGRRNRFEVRNVMGPDEFHGAVNNNAYTNTMAQWNLRQSYELYRELSEEHPGRVKILIEKIKLKRREPKEWKEIAEKIYIPVSPKKKIVQAFDGYFKLRDIVITDWDKNFMPLFPEGVSVSELSKTQLVKQADAVMLLHLLPNLFDEEIKRKSFHYYQKRTVHKSSLSPSIHAIVVLDAGSPTRSYQYFLFALNMDLKGNPGSVGDGIHAGSLGGTWQAAISGFGGMRIREEMLSFDPHLPRHWKKLRFKVKYHGKDLKVSIDKDKLKLFFSSGHTKNPLKVMVYNKVYEILPNETFVFRKESDELQA